jgi:hypothetical protein
MMAPSEMTYQQRQHHLHKDWPIVARQEAYTGHGAKTGGLQQHSIGDMFPYVVIREGARAQWHVAMDMRTGNTGHRRRSYLEAQQDIASLKIRNLMHS